MSRRLLRQAIVSNASVPSVPSLLGRVLALNDAEVDVRELLSIVECDAGLTARILRTANSPFFGQARRVASLHRATVVLGTSMVWNLAVSLTAWEAIGNKLPQSQVAPIWAHSIAVARLAHRIAVRSRAAEEADAFTAGLLHDSGRLILARLYPGSYDPTRVEAGQTARERDLLGADHAEVGAWLFEAWRMPEAIVEAVAAHHAPSPQPGVPAIVAAANFAARLGSPVDGLSQEAVAQLAEYASAVGLDPAVLEEIALEGGDDPRLDG